MIRRLLASAIITLLGVGVSTAADDLRRYEVDVEDFNELIVIEGRRVDYRCNPDAAGCSAGR